MTPATRSLAPLAVLALVAGCASPEGRFPSLAIRDAERVQGTLEPGPADEAPPAPAPPSADLLQRLAQLRSEAQSAHQAFLDAAPGARKSVAAARGAGVENDRWAEAQIALADLDSARSRAAVALGDLDLLFADATLANEAREPIGEAREEVTGLVAQEDAVLAELRGAL